MTAAVIIPFSPADEAPERIAGKEYVTAWYAQHHPRWWIAEAGCPEPVWSKGAAVADAVAALPASVDVFVIADADSFIVEPRILAEAVDLVERGLANWVTPHQFVYRLKQAETDRVLAGGTPRLGHTHRAPYEGPIGGGITVVSRSAFDTVNGIDRRFLGWGGEDIAFGYALETLCPPGRRLTGALVHLWHPHPAPTLRGSPESEALVAAYTDARGLRRRMRAMVDGATSCPALDAVDPVRFRMTANRRTLRLGGGSKIVRFDRGTYTTTDPDEIDALRATPIVTEDRGRT